MANTRIGSSNHIAATLRRHSQSKLNVNTLLKFLLALQATGTRGQNQSNTSPFEYGVPENGTDLCNFGGDKICGQVYWGDMYGDQASGQAASYIVSTRFDAYLIDKVSGSCGDINDTLSLLSELDVLFGNQTCKTTAFSPGRTLHREIVMKNVSEEVCSVLGNYSRDTLTPCIVNTANVFDVACKLQGFNPIPMNYTNDTWVGDYPVSFGREDNQTNLCEGAGANVCESFFIRQDNDTIARGASYLYTWSVRVGDLQHITTNCGNVFDVLSHLPINGSELFGNVSCDMTKRSDGETIQRKISLRNVTQVACDAMKNYSDSEIARCITGAGHSFGHCFKRYPRDDRDDNRSSSGNSFTYLWVLLPIMTIWIFAIASGSRRRGERDAAQSRNTTVAQSTESPSAERDVEAPAVTTSAATTFSHGRNGKRAARRSARSRMAKEQGMAVGDVPLQTLTEPRPPTPPQR